MGISLGTQSWNIAVFCADATAGRCVGRGLAEVLVALGRSVRCHIRQWVFDELATASEFDSALEHLRAADLVIAAGWATTPLSEDLQAVFSEWLVHSGEVANPLVVIPDPEGGGCDLALTALHPLAQRGQAPLYTRLAEAVLATWDLWDWKHATWAADGEGLADALNATRNLLAPRVLV
jgi:hypothetical protein